jgi:hypothetical protein
MQKAAVLLVVLLLLTAGCVGEKQVSDSKKETIISSDAIDLDADGTPDLYVYVLSAYTVPDTSTTLQKYVLVAAENEYVFSNFNQISVEKKKSLDSYFDEFISNKDAVDSECMHNLGLFGVRCLDSTSCLKLCSAGSPTCKQLSEKYGEALGSSVLQYVRDSTELYNFVSSVQDDLPDFNSSSTTKKNAFVGQLAKISYYISSMNANPVMYPGLFGLCEPNDYSLPEIRKLAVSLGKYETIPLEYEYRIFLKADSKKPSSGLEYTDITLKESLPPDASQVQVYGSQQVSSSGGKTTIEWSALKPYVSQNSMLAYTFISKTPPEQIVPSLDRPAVSLKTLNLVALTPVAVLFGIFLAISGNYYFALGMAFAIAIIILITLFNAVMIAYHLFKAKAAGEDKDHALKRAIGRTGMRWKSDVAIGIILFIAGILIAFFYAPHLSRGFDVFQMIELLTNADLLSGFLAAFFIFGGCYLLFSALENYLKITTLEKIYGKHFTQDKDLFVTRVAQLKEKIAELTELLGKLGKENFEVGTEYDVLSRISVKHVDELAKKGDSHARRMIEEYLTHVEDAVDGLLERKKTADENWQSWSMEIEKLVDQHEEVYVSNLITIPASLRLWALNKFASEHAAKGIIFEGDVVRKKAVTPEKMTKSLLEKDLLIGAIVVKNGKLVLSQMAGGSGTVSGVLSIKLFGYLRSLATRFRLHEAKNVAVVGEKNVLALLKYQDVESVIIMKKENFKAAIEDWKEKMKNF